jgi:hypothetical protein
VSVGAAEVAIGGGVHRRSGHARDRSVDAISPRAADPTAILGALAVFADVLAPKVAAHLRAEGLSAKSTTEPPVTWYTQATSPLPRRLYLNLCRRGVVASRRVGKTVLVECGALDAWIRVHGAAAPAPSASASLAAAAPADEALMRAAGFSRVAPRAAVPDLVPASGRRRDAERRAR